MRGWSVGCDLGFRTGGWREGRADKDKSGRRRAARPEFFDVGGEASVGEA